MSSRSQRALRFREGYDNSGATAYQRGERSLRTNIYQRTEALKRGGKPPPANTVAPAVTGTPTVGQTLTTTNGTWTALSGPTFTRQWFAEYRQPMRTGRLVLIPTSVALSRKIPRASRIGDTCAY